MGGDADRPLGQRDAEFLAHLARHPRVVGRRAGPGALVEAAEDHEVGALQPCLQQAPDEKPWMATKAWPHLRACEQAFEQSGIVAAGSN